MQSASATLETANAARYLGQLCKHFAHKIEVDYAPETPLQGEIRFPFGKAVLDADDSALRMHVEAEDSEQLERAKQVLESHLLRFTFREKVESLDWTH